LPKEIVKDYGKWEAHPHVPDISVLKLNAYPEMKKMQTMYEGSLTYLRFWNFWVRAATVPSHPSDFFNNYESGTPQVWNLINAVGAPTAWPQSDEEKWNRISTVWNWLTNNVTNDPTEYGTLIAVSGNWPSIDVYAQYYAQHNNLVWAACFSKAHLFATLLGRVLPRWHVTIALAHHTEGGAPPTASHVYVGVYLTDRWYYLDPTSVYAGPLPTFQGRKSVGLFTKVDYEHPFDAIPVPLSSLDKVPYLGF
jgi:hypothetical protein